MSVTRRLSARRGSTTAADPYAKNAHLNCESSSILTIVRVASPPVTPVSAPEAPSSARRAHRRIGSNPNSPIAAPSAEPPPGRLSFAFSSFAAPHQQSGHSGAAAHPPRPASPNRSPSSSTFASKPRLTPDQLLEVAKQATNPRYVTVAPSHSSSGSSHSPVISARSSSPQHSVSHTVVPATFTPLPPGVYLPFLDRPVEVKALLSSPPSAKLFSLLAQTFPKNVPPRQDDALPINTADWTFADLSHWLNETTREEASDAFWVQTARRCILLHSELIWERLKGALGVPPELDVEYTEAQYNDVFEDDDEESDGSTKHWDDWDAALDSPAYSSPNVSRRTSVVQTSSSTPGITTELPTPQSDYFTYSPIESSSVIIEPVLASAESAHPPPLSLPASLSAETAGLGDIGEEDEENEDSTPKEEPPPAQLHGLRISTPASPMPSLPSPVIRSATTGAPIRSPSFSARAHSPTFARSSSRSSLHRSGSFGSVHSLGSERDVPYDPVADRAPGNPIFPSNFARLALGPTLAANNPALRSPVLPPQSRYTGPRRSSSTRSERGNRFRRSWAGGDEYAVTVASSSAGGSVRDAGGADEA